MNAILSMLLSLMSVTVSLIPEPPSLPKEKTAEDMDITGMYYVEGKIGGKKDYKGMALISRLEAVYIVQWTLMGNDEQILGIGMRHGEKLSVSWHIQAEKGIARGITVYDISHGKSGPVLRGKWLVVPGSGTPNDETLRHLKQP